MLANKRNGFVRTFLPLFLALVTPTGMAQSRARGREASVQSAADLSATLEETSLAVGPSVVEIFTTSYKPTGGMIPRTADLITAERASGSGVIVDPDWLHCHQRARRAGRPEPACRDFTGNRRPLNSAPAAVRWRDGS
jgi:hypothetical protein